MRSFLHFCGTASAAAKTGWQHYGQINQIVAYHGSFGSNIQL
jgi:hypothetical protein